MVFFFVTFALLPLLFLGFPKISVWLLAGTAFLGSLYIIFKRDRRRKFNRMIPKEINFIFFCLSLMVAIEFAHFDNYSISNCLYLIASLASCYIGYHEVIIEKSERRRKYEIYFLLLSLSFVSIFLFFNDNLNELNYEVNANFVGGIVLVIGFLMVSCYSSTYFNFYLLFLFILAILYFSGTRSAFVGLISGIVIVFGFKNRRARLFFIASVCIALILALPSLIDFFTDPYVNAVFMEATGKNLETGRIMVWRFFLDSLNWKSFLFGEGAAANYMLKVDSVSKVSGFSIHNGYLSILARNGVFALLIFLFLLYNIFQRLEKKERLIGRASLAFFLAFCVREFFEVTLHANNFPIVALFWFAVGSALSQSNANTSNLSSIGDC